MFGKVPARSLWSVGLQSKFDRDQDLSEPQHALKKKHTNSMQNCHGTITTAMLSREFSEAEVDRRPVFHFDQSRARGFVSTCC